MSVLHSAAALALAGQPPLGLGVYARGQSLSSPFTFNVGESGATWRFVSVTDGAAGVVVANIATAIRQCIEGGQTGVVVDAESTYTAAQVDALADAMNEGSKRVRFGFTSFLFWPGLGRLAQRLSRRVWLSPQCFNEPATNARGWAHWSSLFGAGRLIPSAKGYVVGAHTTPEMAAQLRTDAGYRAYLETVPRAGGVIVWPNWPLLSHMPRALHDRWGAPLPRLQGAARAVVLSPALVVVFVVALVVAALLTKGF